jgi:hypothetical protein
MVPMASTSFGFADSFFIAVNLSDTRALMFKFCWVENNNGYNYK